MKIDTKAFFDGYRYEVIREVSLAELSRGAARTDENLYWVQVVGITGVLLIHEYGDRDGYEVYKVADNSNTVAGARQAIFGESG